MSQNDTNKQMESDASSVTLGGEDWPEFRTLERDSGYESDQLTASGGLQQGIKRRRDSGQLSKGASRSAVATDDFALVSRDMLNHDTFFRF